MKTLIMSVVIVFLTITCSFAQSEGSRSEGPKSAPADWGPQREAFLEKYDADGNGELSPEERAQARADRRDKGFSGKGRRSGPPLTAEQRQKLLEKFDANGDGELGPDERQAARTTVQSFMLERFDANENGQLDPEERQAIAKASRKMQGKRNLERRAKIRDRFDANGDGVLDESERAAAREAVRERRQKNQGAG